MPDISELNLKPEPVPEQLVNTPEERGAWLPPLPPGDYEFRLPMNLPQLWDKFTYDGREYLYVNFNKDAPLIVVGSAQDAGYVGYTWTGVINSMPKDRRSKREKDAGVPEKNVSDLTYLVRAFEPGAFAETGTAFLTQYAQTLNKYAGKVFGAENEWKAQCKKKQIKWIQEPPPAPGQFGKVIEDPQKGLGCGNSVFQRELQERYMQADGQWPTRITCPTPNCFASLRPQGELRRFRPGTIE